MTLIMVHRDSEKGQIHETFYTTESVESVMKEMYDRMLMMKTILGLRIPTDLDDLKKPVSELNLNFRLKTVIKELACKTLKKDPKNVTVYDIIDIGRDRIKTFPNLGEKSLKMLDEELERLGIYIY